MIFGVNLLDFDLTDYFFLAGVEGKGVDAIFFTDLSDFDACVWVLDYFFGYD